MRTSSSFRSLAAACIAFAAFGGTALPSQEQLTVTLGVYSFKRPTDVYRDFLPATDALSKALTSARQEPVLVELRVFKTYDECIDALVADRVDFVRFGPASYVTARQRNPKVKLLAVEEEYEEKRSKGVGVIAVAKDSPIQTIADLAGRRFAFGDENSTIGRYLSQAQLVAAGIRASDLAKCEFLGRHDKVFKAVEVGDYDAGALHVSILENLNKSGQLRVIAYFDNVGKPWVGRATLDAKLTKQLTDALTGLKDKPALKALKIASLEPAKDADFELVRTGMEQAKRFDEPRAAPGKD
ncbi:MAG: PhnD/SsuA/transferrin family substrate-binding protein [Planctomycetota bacterium]